MSFIGRLFEEVTTNGKMLVGYLVTQVPELTSFPGLITSAKTAISDRTPASFFDLGAQIFLAVAAAHRAGKIVVNASKVK